MVVPPWKKSSQKKDYVKRITENFPEIKFSKSKIIRHGFDNDVVILDDKLVFRFPRPDYQARFKSELTLLRRLRGQFHLKIPDYNYVPKNDVFGGYEIINGQPLSKTLFNRLPQKTKMVLAAQLGQFLTDLHSVKLAEVKAAGFSNEAQNQWWAQEKCEKDYQKFKATVLPKLEVSIGKWVSSKYEAYLALAPRQRAVAIHSDLGVDHILYSKPAHKIDGIIDFTDLEIGDPAMDFVGLWVYGTEFVELVFEHYKQPTGKDFLERSKYPKLLTTIPYLLDSETKEHEYFSFEENLNKLKEVIKQNSSF
jgi:aminoglycoside 2''-phosphotransferase